LTEQKQKPIPQSTVDALQELDRITQLFQSSELVGKCSKILIRGPSIKPSSRWSLPNQILMLLQGTEDARGFQQWREADRTVLKGRRAIYILRRGPRRSKCSTKRLRRKKPKPSSKALRAWRCSELTTRSASTVVKPTSISCESRS
jgi:hypothetical protein